MLFAHVQHKIFHTIASKTGKRTRASRWQKEKPLIFQEFSVVGLVGLEPMSSVRNSVLSRFCG